MSQHERKRKKEPSVSGTPVVAEADTVVGVETVGIGRRGVGRGGIWRAGILAETDPGWSVHPV